MRFLICFAVACISSSALASPLHPVSAGEIRHHAFVRGGVAPTDQYDIVQLRDVPVYGNPTQRRDYNVFVSVRKDILTNNTPEEWGADPNTTQRFQQRVTDVLEVIANTPDGQSALEKYRTSPANGEEFALYIYELSSEPIGGNLIEETPGYILEGYTTSEAEFTEQVYRRDVSITSERGRGASSNIGLRASRDFFDANHVALYRTLPEELIQSIRAAWGVSPPIRPLIGFEVLIDDFHQRLHFLLEELEASGDIPSPEIVNPLTGKRVVLSYGSMYEQMIGSLANRGIQLKGLKEVDSISGYASKAAAELLDSIVLKPDPEHELMIEISPELSAREYNSFLSNLERRDILLYREHLEGLQAWCREIAYGSQKIADESLRLKFRQLHSDILKTLLFTQNRLSCCGSVAGLFC